MKEEIELFLTYLQEKRDFSGNSLQAYGHDLRQMEQWLEDQGIRQTEQVTAEHLSAYLKALSAAGRSESTLRRNRSVMAGYFAYCCGLLCLPSNPACDLQLPSCGTEAAEQHSLRQKKETEEKEKRLPEILPCGLSDGSESLRDAVLLHLELDCTLGPALLGRILTEDLDLEGCFLRVIRNGLQQYQAFSGETRDLLRRYLAGHTQERLFVNASGGPMSRQGIWKVLKKYGCV